MGCTVAVINRALLRAPGLHDTRPAAPYRLHHAGPLPQLFNPRHLF